MVISMSEKGKEIIGTNNGKLRIERGNDRLLFVGDDGISKMLIGPRLDGELAVELAQAGSNVLTAADASLIFSSRFDSFKIVQTDQVTIAPFNVPANTNGNGSITATYDSPSIDSPIVLAFTNSLPSGGLFLWQGVSPESTLSAPTSSPMGFTVYTRFDTIVSPGVIIGGRPQVQLSFQATVRNATGSAINGITYEIIYFVLVETAPA